MAAGEDLEMDEFDAIKAFTQACVDKLLYVEMPEGFAIPGYVLELLRALEGIKQGANLFMKLNSSTWTPTNNPSPHRVPPEPVGIGPGERVFATMDRPNFTIANDFRSSNHILGRLFSARRLLEPGR